MSFAAEEARARVLTGVVLPLLETVARERPALARRLAAARGTVQIEVRGSSVASRLRLEGGTLHVEAGRGPSDVRCVFPDLAHLNAFFAGKPTLPRIEPAWGLKSARLLFEAGRLLAELRVLEPPSARVRARMDDAERALRVRLVLDVVLRSIAVLHDLGWPPAVDLAAASPERVYQWTVGGGIGAWLRVDHGAVEAGAGTYAARRPFVHFTFPDVRAAFDVLMAEESSMKGFRGGSVETLGSPEYARKVSLLMQEVDALLSPGSAAPAPKGRS